MHALLLAAALALSPLDRLAGEKQIVDVKELAGSRWALQVRRDDGLPDRSACGARTGASIRC